MMKRWNIYSMIMILRDWENIHKLPLLWNFPPINQGWQWHWWVLITKNHEVSHFLNYFKGYLQEDHVKPFCLYFFYSQEIKPKDDSTRFFPPILFKWNTRSALSHLQNPAFHVLEIIGKHVLFGALMQDISQDTK